VTAFDFSSAAIALARERHTGPRYEVADAVGPPNQFEKFDALIDVGCLHELRPETHQRYRDNVVAWSRSGTRYILVMRCKEHTPRQRMTQVQELFRDWFDLAFMQERPGMFPSMPDLTMIVFCMQRKQAIASPATARP
jgi:hypothetical protein